MIAELRVILDVPLKQFTYFLTTRVNIPRVYARERNEVALANASAMGTTNILIRGKKNVLHDNMVWKRSNTTHTSMAVKRAKELS